MMEALPTCQDCVAFWLNEQRGPAYIGRVSLRLLLMRSCPQFSHNLPRVSNQPRQVQPGGLHELIASPAHVGGQLRLVVFPGAEALAAAVADAPPAYAAIVRAGVYDAGMVVLAVWAVHD